MAAATHLGKQERSYWGVVKRECDSCHLSPALLFCHPHSAFLCSSCDSQIHDTITTAPHARVWLCEICEQNPAAFTCKADAAALCPSCDADIHAANHVARRHDRLPISPFFHTPSFKQPAVVHHAHDSRLLPTLGILNTHKPVIDSDDVDPFLDLEYASQHMDSVVPAQTKAPSPFSYTTPPMQQFEIDFTGSNPSSYSHSVSSSDAAVVPEVTSNPGAANPVVTPAVGMDRIARVLRYREKRKNRKFEKTIRYASRKAYAETRPRIKGRFAKRMEADAEARVAEVGIGGSFFSRPRGLMMDLAGYGVVPTF